MAKSPLWGGPQQGGSRGGVRCSLPFGLHLRGAFLLLLLVAVPTFYNFREAWERTVRDSWPGRALAPATLTAEIVELPLPATLKGIKLVSRERLQSSQPNQSTRLTTSLQLDPDPLLSHNPDSNLVSDSVSENEGRTAAAVIVTWPWFTFLTPNRGTGGNASSLTEPSVKHAEALQDVPGAAQRAGATDPTAAVSSGSADVSGVHYDVSGAQADASGTETGVNNAGVGGRRIGGGSRKAIASVMERVEDALSGAGDTIKGSGGLPRALRSRDLSAILPPEQCPAFSPDHFRRLAGLPEPQLLPTPEAPFLFLHNRKCGGSTLRHLVHESAVARGLTSYIPCFAPVACETYDLANVTSAVGGDVSVVAGHFSWDAVAELRGGANMSCYTTLRDPVEMFASYFYQRHPLAAIEGRNLSSVSSQALRHTLDTIPSAGPGDEYFLQWWAELGGPANSAGKMMTSADITGHQFGADSAEYTKRRKGRPLNLAEAKRNLDQCVVGLLSDWETTLEVLNHWFPWIQTSSWRENKGENRPSEEVLPEAIKAVILEYMDLDVQLYKYGLERFAKEKELVAHLRADQANGCTIV